MEVAEIRALLRPNAFPHPVDGPTLLETHISWVVLTGDFAYKIKKPVAMDFLDFTSVESRRHFCEEELRLNRRLAPELYLEVVTIAESEEGPCVDGDGPVLDYAVRMRQFDQRCLASRAADEGRLTAARCRELGRTVADFHNSLEPLSPAATDPAGPGTPDAIFAAARQNFAQIRERLPAGEDLTLLDELEEAALADRDALEPAMWRRLEGGYVRDCHGDLHLGNIVLLSERVVPFDCIEFNPAFRLIDIQCEIGFLVMDLDSRELPDLANIVLNTWLEYTGDYAGLRLHRFYDVYLAMVRAKIGLFAASAGGDASPDLSTYRRYLALAAAGRRRLPRFLCLMMGVSGSGKSTVAGHLTGGFSAIRLRSDVERKRLFGLSPDADSAAAGLGTELYRPATSDRVFAHLEELASSLLEAGLPVVVDATFIEHARRQPFQALAERLGVPFIIAQCVAEEAELERRLRRRQGSGERISEAGIEIMRRQLHHIELPGPEEIDHVITVDTLDPDHPRRLASEVERRITSSIRD